MQKVISNEVNIEERNKKILIVAEVVSALVAIGVAAFLYLNAQDAPPKLTLGGEGVQGMIDSGDFLQYQDRDRDTYREFIEDYRDRHEDAEKFELSSGVNYVYLPRDIEVGDLRKCIDPKANRVVFAQYDAEEGNFLVYPEGPFQDTVEIEELDHKFKKGTGMVIISEKSSDTYCVADPEDKSDVDVVDPMDEDTDGWVLLASNEDNVEDFIKSFKDRVEKVWMMVDDNEFEKVKASDYDEDLEDFYLLWLKLDEGENGDSNSEDDDDDADSVAPKNLKFEVDMEAFENRLIWDRSPAKYNDKDLTGYMVSVRTSDQSVEDAQESYVTPDKYTENNGKVTLLLGEIFPGDVYLMRVGSVYDGDQDTPHYSEEIQVAIADDGEVVPPADLGVVPTNIIVDADNADEEGDRLDINGDGKINFRDVFIGVSWTRVASVEGRTVNGYKVKWSLCENVGGEARNCEEKPIANVEGANSFEYQIRNEIEFGTIYKVSVAADIEERNDDLKYSEPVEFALPAVDELFPNDFADVFSDLSVPMNLHVTNVQNGSVSLAWDGVTGDGSELIPGYEVLYMPFDLSSDFSDEDDRTVEVFGRVNEATIDGLSDDGRQYVFAVKVKGFAYDGDYFSNYVFVVPKAGSDGFAAPEMGQVTALEDGKVRISGWGTPGLPNGYIVKNFVIVAHDDKKFIEPKVVDGGVRSAEIDDLELDREYEFAIFAIYEIDGKTVASDYSEWEGVRTVEEVAVVENIEPANQVVADQGDAVSVKVVKIETIDVKKFNIFGNIVLAHVDGRYINVDPYVIGGCLEALPCYLPVADSQRGEAMVTAVAAEGGSASMMPNPVLVVKITEAGDSITPVLVSGAISRMALDEGDLAGSCVNNLPCNVYFESQDDVNGFLAALAGFSRVEAEQL